MATLVGRGSVSGGCAFTGERDCITIGVSVVSGTYACSPITDATSSTSGADFYASSSDPGSSDASSSDPGSSDAGSRSADTSRGRAYPSAY
jgi:hypothetical protein